MKNLFFVISSKILQENLQTLNGGRRSIGTHFLLRKSCLNAHIFLEWIKKIENLSSFTLFHPVEIYPKIWSKWKISGKSIKKKSLIASKILEEILQNLNKDRRSIETYLILSKSCFKAQIFLDCFNPFPTFLNFTQKLSNWEIPGKIIKKEISALTANIVQEIFKT